MVAKITPSKSLKSALVYNEKKVQNGKAAFLFAGNFLQHERELDLPQKLGRLQRLNQLNASRTNTLHISLNFHPDEQLSTGKMTAVAQQYIQLIGFGEQPFLVYQHFDAAHPHLHIVTTMIRENGTRINIHNIGRHASRRAIKQLEEQFGLRKAADGSQPDQEPTLLQTVRYGLVPTKKSMEDVLQHVIHAYVYTSLPELNAVLKLYYLMADRGSEGGWSWRYGGLYYRLLDDRGNKVGLPLKASALSGHPTLGFLEGKFRLNSSLSPRFSGRLKTAIDWTLAKNPSSLEAFMALLEKEKVRAITYGNTQGFVYEMTFIDLQARAVFKGSDLGEGYSAAAIRNKLKNGHCPQKNPVADLLVKRPIDKGLEGLQPK